MKMNGLCLTFGTELACGIQCLLSGYYHCFFLRRLSSMFIDWNRTPSAMSTNERSFLRETSVFDNLLPSA